MNDDNNNNNNDTNNSHVDHHPVRSIGHFLRLVIVAALVAGIVVVALDNRKDVRIGYAVGHAFAPVWIVLVAAAATGIVIGWLLRHRGRRTL